MREGIALIAFSGRGLRLAERIAANIGGTVSRAGEDVSLSAWTELAFREKRALIFVGAVGIAVRAVAPYLGSKAEDPAVIAVDELGKAVIPLLSGHLGGANELARRIAESIDAQAVITTATDLNGVFAVDLWAGKQGMKVLQPGRIRQVSGALLRGEKICIECRWDIHGEPPEQVFLGSPGKVLVDYRVTGGEALQLIPRILVIGIGCRRGTEKTVLEEELGRFCEERGIHREAIAAAASVDRKADEEGLLRFCESQGWPVYFYTAEELHRVRGSFSSSPFVEETLGVDNVCERAAVRLGGGRLVERKFAENGVTFALAEARHHFDWSW